MSRRARWRTAGSRLGGWTAVTALLTGCSHDADRSNPLDPALTPPVQAVEARTTARVGAVLVIWQPYAGDQPFAAYAVLRKEQGRERVDTLGVLADVAVTTFLDTLAAPDRDYEYRVAVANGAGYAVTSAAAAVRSASVEGIALQSADGDGTGGLVRLRWQPYAGPGFGGLSVWRQVFRQEAVEVWSTTDPAAAAYVDTGAVPGVVYAYWLRTRLFDETLESLPLQVSYDLPPVAVAAAVASSLTATAQVTWSPYAGPRFAAYEVLRRQPGRPDTVVAVLDDPASTASVDAGLDGNTDYTYLVRVRTTWDGVAVAGAGRTARFYALDPAVVRYSPPENTEVQALDVAVDAADGLWGFATFISTTTARLMQGGVSVYRPGSQFPDTKLRGVRPDRLSPVHGAVLDGAFYVAVRDTSGRVVVAGFGADGSQAWADTVDTGGQLPVALFVEAGGVVLVDEQALLYRFDAATGERGAPLAALQTSLASQEGLPVQHVIEAPGIGRAGNDQWIVLSPLRSEHRILGRTQLTLGTTPIFGGTSDFYDDGVGPGRGESLSPLAVGFDARHGRLVLLENHGLVQVMDAGVDVSPRGVTSWGDFGEADGEFFFTPPTAAAVAVDSRGRVLVADAGARGGRVQVFVP